MKCGERLGQKQHFHTCAIDGIFYYLNINFSTTNFLFNLPLFASDADEVAFREGFHLKPISLITYKNKTNRFVYIPCRNINHGIIFH